jgi:uracil phosphoribosyltransferase
MEDGYRVVTDYCRGLDAAESQEEKERLRLRIIDGYNSLGDLIQEIVAEERSIRVYSFETPQSARGEASRLIAKLRNVNTQNAEFVYYTQRAYELLFNLAFVGTRPKKKNYIVVETPVREPFQNYAVHKIPDIDNVIHECVMCVMLRGALLPSMIVSKEIQEYSSGGYLTPFALFKVYRNDKKSEEDMEYTLDLDRSFFVPEELDGKNLVFADPMNATGGSLVTIMTFLLNQGIKPRNVIFLNVISALKGALRVARAVQNSRIYTLWMDPVLNEKAYIVPGLGDAGDRLNGPDDDTRSRNIIQLISGYGRSITSLYRAQIGQIENSVLNRPGKEKGAG